MDFIGGGGCGGVGVHKTEEWGLNIGKNSYPLIWVTPVLVYSIS
jgi:hypothetical protein